MGSGFYLRFQANQIIAISRTNAADPQIGDDLCGVGVGFGLAGSA